MKKKNLLLITVVFLILTATLSFLFFYHIHKFKDLPTNNNIFTYTQEQQLDYIKVNENKLSKKDSRTVYHYLRKMVLSPDDERNQSEYVIAGGMPLELNYKKTRETCSIVLFSDYIKYNGTYYKIENESKDQNATFYQLIQNVMA